MKQGSPVKVEWTKHDLFDGDLTEEGSDIGDDASIMAPSTSYASSINTHKTAKAWEQPSRPQRSKKVVSYDESSSEESITDTPVAATNRKRRLEQVQETPNKRPRTTLSGSKSPEVTPKKEQKQSLKQQTSTGVAASQLVSTPVSSQPTKMLVTSPVTQSNRPLYIYLSFDGQPSTHLSTPQGYWWPAKNISRAERSATYVFQLYGDDGKGESRTFTIEENFPHETLSMWYPAPPTPRFNQNDFQTDERIDKSSFMKACSIALHDDMDEDEDEDEDEIDRFPTPGLLDFSKTISSQESDWSPPDYRSLVGCRVLCRKAGSDRHSPHWPARVKEYIPPKSKAEKPMFVMDFFDWKVAKVTRDCFFTPEDEDRDQFARCNIDYKKLVGIWEEKNTAADIELDELDVTQLPEPITPIPEPIKFVEHLTIEQQFVYIIPFLQRILAEGYSPSQQRIDLWMRGGVSRSAILNNPIQSGNMVEVDYERLGYLLPMWVDKTYPPIQTVTSQLNHTSLEPESNGLQDSNNSRASRRFRELSMHDRTQFITDVLLGEAVVQLLLFREGKRASLDILDDEQEAKMHATGMVLSTEESASRLVRTVMEERQRARRERKLAPEASETIRRALPTQRAAQRAVAQGSQGS